MFQWRHLLDGMTNDKPLVDADLITERDFCFEVGNRGPAANDSKESVLELCLSSIVASLLAAAKSNLKSTKSINVIIFILLNTQVALLTSSKNIYKTKTNDKANCK